MSGSFDVDHETALKLHELALAMDAEAPFLEQMGLCGGDRFSSYGFVPMAFDGLTDGFAADENGSLAAFVDRALREGFRVSAEFKRAAHGRVVAAIVVRGPSARDTGATATPSL